MPCTLRGSRAKLSTDYLQASGSSRCTEMYGGEALAPAVPATSAQSARPTPECLLASLPGTRTSWRLLRLPRFLSWRGASAVTFRAKMTAVSLAVAGVTLLSLAVPIYVQARTTLGTLHGRRLLAMARDVASAL